MENSTKKVDPNYFVDRIDTIPPEYWLDSAGLEIRGMRDDPDGDYMTEGTLTSDTNPEWYAIFLKRNIAGYVVAKAAPMQLLELFWLATRLAKQYNLTVRVFGPSNDPVGFAIDDGEYARRIKMNHIRKTVEAFLAVLNEDKDGGFFICEEARAEVDALRGIVGFLA